MEFNMLTYFVDECGNTGRNLLNQDQPVYGLSAVLTTDVEATSLVNKHFPRSKADELKYKSLRKRPTFYQGIVDLHRDLLEQEAAISFIAEKKYCAVQKMLDDCIEPLYHASGGNFYQNGFNRMFASMLYHCAPAMCGVQWWDDFLSAYVNCSRQKSIESLRHLSVIVSRCGHPEIRKHLYAIEHIHPVYAENILNLITDTDIGYSILRGMVTRLELAGEEYVIISDETSSLKRYEDVLAAETSYDGPTKDFKFSELASLSYPLKLRGVSYRESKESSGVQLADVVAGAAVDASLATMGIREGNDLTNHIFENYSENSFLFLFPIPPDEFGRMPLNDIADHLSFVCALQGE